MQPWASLQLVGISVTPEDAGNSKEALHDADLQLLNSNVHLHAQLVGISVTPEDAGNFKDALRDEDITGPQGVGDLGPAEVSYI